MSQKQSSQVLIFFFVINNRYSLSLLDYINILKVGGEEIVGNVGKILKGIDDFWKGALFLAPPLSD